MTSNYIETTIEQVNIEVEARGGSVDRELAKLYALLALTTGTGTTLRHVHEAWGVWRTESNPSHHSLIPFGDLAPEVQAYDEIYRDAIIAVAQGGTAALAAGNDETRTISGDEYDELKSDADFLGKLQDAGVDNWDGYEVAQSS